MKKMKKALASLLAATMVMSMSVTAWADTTDPDASTEGVPSMYIDQGEVALIKNYKITNTGTSNPAETFEFEIEKVAVTDSEYTKENMPMPSFSKTETKTEGTIAFTKGEATAEGDINYTKLYLPDYDSVGIFTYKITEKAGNTAGVTYDSNPIYLKVTAIEQDGIIRVAALHYEKENGDKTKNFENVYAAGALEISKTVEGTLGDKTKYFEFKVQLTGEENKTYEETYTVTGGSSESNPAEIKVGEETIFYLKDKDTITIDNLPYGVTYTVKEVDYASDGYTTESVFSDEKKEIDSVKDTVAFTNTKNGDIDTGILLDSAPYVLLLALAGVGAFAVATKKREEEF